MEEATSLLLSQSLNLNEAIKAELNKEKKSMKAITLWQPWGTLWAAGIKEVETRSWSATSRLQLPIRILIHAASRAIMQEEVNKIYSDLLPEFCLSLSIPSLSTGCILGAVTLTKCEYMTPSLIANTSSQEKALGLWQVGRWAWYGTDFILLEKPVKSRGKQGFWTPELEVLSLVEQQLEVKHVA